MSYVPARILRSGSDIYTYFEQNPDEGREFRDAMTSMTTMWAPYVVQLINTDKVSCAVDVGGADGSLLARMQRANEDLYGINFERPQVAAEVERQVFEGEFGDRTEDRCRRLLRRRAAADLHLLKMILACWDGCQCVEISKRCREAMYPGGRVVIIEQVVGLTTIQELEPRCQISTFSSSFKAVGSARSHNSTRSSKPPGCGA